LCAAFPIKSKHNANNRRKIPVHPERIVKRFEIEHDERFVFRDVE
jgi:hypothetical protein